MCVNKLLFEFRAFGQSFGETEKKLLELGKGLEPKENYDYYIVSAANSTFNILIRNKKLIIKELISTVEKLEKWNVNFVGDFPISKDVIENTFFPATGLEAPNVDNKLYNIIDFIENVVNADPDLKIVEVFKSKTEFMFNNCNCEIAVNLINGAMIRTFNIESENTADVFSTFQLLEVGDNYVNTNYPLKIKQITGIEPLTNYKI